MSAPDVQTESFPPSVPDDRPPEPKVEAAGIEPARNAHRISYSVSIAGIEFEVRFDGKHLNLHLYGEDQIWQFEPLETALPKLEALTKVARLAQEAT